MESLDRLIECDTEGLRTTLRLIRNHVPVADWPGAIRAALELAISPTPADSPYEHDKAHRLRDRLGVATRIVSPPNDHPHTTRRLAERLRADLTDLVPPDIDTLVI
jgi:hypothetical protein